MGKKIFLLLLFIQVNRILYTQEDSKMYIKNNYFNDSTSLKYCAKKGSFNKLIKSPYSGLIIPSFLITYGALSKVSKPLKEIDKEINKEVTEHIKFKTNMDDYLRYVPSIAVYGFHIAGIKPKNNYRDQTFIILNSHIINDFIVGKLKKTTSIQRPEGDNTSFPSSHTSVAFVGAHILFKEYNQASLWTGVSGYMVATTTGIMRIINNKHWASDVIAGAGIGILCTEISYLLLPTFQKIVKSKPDKQIGLTPLIDKRKYGVGLTYTF
jgi:membrane-associated phospholipid phosphatase